MEYVSVAEARNLPGLRLVLTAGSPGPWGEAAKALFKLRGVPFVPVQQFGMAANEELVEWTGVRNAPVAVYDNETAVSGWLDILNLAERLGSGPSLLPDEEFQRILALGLSAEIAGAGGFGWERRITMLRPDRPMPMADSSNVITRTYGVRPEAAEPARRRVIAILGALASVLERQRGNGSDYFVGDRISAADVYWACFSQLVGPMPEERCPMGEVMRATYDYITPEIAAAVDPALMRHRDMVWERHIGLPMQF